MRALSLNDKTTLNWNSICFFWITLRETPAEEENTNAHAFTTCLHMILCEHGVTRYPAPSEDLGNEHRRQSALFSSQFRALFALVSILKWRLSSVCHFYCRAASKTGVKKKNCYIETNVHRQGVRSPVVNICTKCPNIKILCSLPPRDCYLFHIIVTINREYFSI